MSSTNTILQIDIGNTRAKWRLQGEQNYRGFCLSDIESIERLLQNLQQQKITLAEIQIATVKNTEYIDALTRCCKAQWGLTPVFAKTQKQTLGITNSYLDESCMGVDRWSALVAAVQDLQQQGKRQANKLCCVVDAGSAMTLDFVHLDDTGGEHLGGYIVPGYRMQHAALLGGTHRVAVSDQSPTKSLAPGRDTQSAVSSGILASLVALINITCQSIAQKYELDLQVYLTGGDAESLKPFLGETVVHSPDLVLDGIQLLLESDECVG